MYYLLLSLQVYYLAHLYNRLHFRFRHEASLVECTENVYTEEKLLTGEIII